MADSEGEARSQAVNHHLIGGACLLAVRLRCDEIRNKAERSGLQKSPRLLMLSLGRHDFPFCRENSLASWESIPHFLWCLLVFSGNDSVILNPHTTL